MSIQKVTEKILEDAEKEAKEITAKYEREAANIAADFANRIAQEKQQMQRDIEERKETEVMRNLSQHRLALNKKQTEYKQRLIHDTVEAKLSEHSEYFVFLKELIKKGGIETGELVINKNDLKRHRQDLEKFLEKEGFNLKIVEDDGIKKGGVILRHGTTHYIGSLDIILELLSDELAIAISKSIF
jgi:V/A-type H+-transporting ATPase subunit E